jgi:hypothetical protein
MRLRSAENDMAANVGKRPSHIHPAASEVDIAHAQSGSLAPAQPRVAEDQAEYLPGTSFSLQIRELVVSEEYVVTAAWPRQAYSVSWVGADTPAAHRVPAGKLPTSSPGSRCLGLLCGLSADRPGPAGPGWDGP